MVPEKKKCWGTKTVGVLTGSEREIFADHPFRLALNATILSKTYKLVTVVLMVHKNLKNSCADRGTH